MPNNRKPAQTTSAEAPPPAAPADETRGQAERAAPRLVHLPLKEIHVDERLRRAPLEIERLAASIEEIGLLQPILVTAANQLVAGQRRLQAHRLLNRDTIPCYVVEDMQDTALLLRAEITENTCRIPFTPSELVGAAEALLPLARSAAQNRMRHVVAQEGSENFSEAGEALIQIARLLGISRPTLEKARKVVQAARENRRLYGDLQTRMDRDGKVDPIYKELMARQKWSSNYSPVYFAIRLNANGAIKITGADNKVEIIHHLYRIIEKLRAELQQEPPS